MKLTIMLMGGSALLLLGLLGIYFNSSPEGNQLTFNILEISKVVIPLEAQRIFFPLTFIGFGVLGALFPFHTWSPDGHASAPTAVSMLHAGVLMKLGGYGAFRVAIFLMPQAAHELAWIFIILTSISVVYGAFGAIAQKDLKYINAYSSVSHCGLVLFAVLMMNQTAMNGAVIQMISHGLMTALFFALIGMLYGRTHTRMISEMGGLMKVIPFLSVCYVIAGLASLGLPGLSGFVAEMTIFVGAFQHPELFYRVVTILAVSSIVITAVYILRVVAVLLLGPTKNPHFEHLPDARWFEKISVVSLIVAVAAIGLAPFWLSTMIGTSLNPIIEKIVAINPF
jgi:NADH-quinone oxidoreductase subunit M